MKKNSNFPFIDNSILQENLDIVFDHIIELISVLESNNYKDTVVSSFCKTIIMPANFVKILV